MNKKAILVIGVTLLVIAASAGGAITYVSIQKAKPSSVFEQYLETFASMTSYDATQSLNGSGVDGIVMATFNTTEKQSMMNVAVSCVAKTASSDSAIKAVVQRENENTYLKFDSVTGSFTQYNGTKLDLAKTYSRAIGQWYKYDDENISAKAQLNSGVFVSNTSLIAPNYDTAKVVSALLDKGAIKFTSVKHQDSKYVFHVVASRANYQEVLKTVVPNLSNSDLVMEDAFGSDPSIESDVTTDSNGKFVEERLQVPNPCADIVQLVTGEAANNIPSRVSSVAKSASKSDVKIIPVLTSKSFKTLAADRAL